MVSSLKCVTIPIQDIVNNNYRLEAACYNIESIRAKSLLESLSIDLKNLAGENGIAEVFYPIRFKRIYVNKSEYPLILPSQITHTHIKPENYMSKKTLSSYDKLQVSANEILLTRSGTIGKVRYTTSSLHDLYMSDDIIRVKCFNLIDTPYAYAFLRTNIGQTMLSTKPYGAVIQHIEPDHLNSYPIPYPPENIRKDIGDKIVQSFEKRDLSNDMIDKAENLLITYLNLPPIEGIEHLQYDPSVAVNNFSIDISKWQNRLEAKYHNPTIQMILDILIRSNSEIVPLGNNYLSTNILLPGRFKRVYVERDQGTVFLGGKQIYELDPFSKKYLSVKAHGDRIASQLFLHENMIAITCSGTIGRVSLIPKHWENWTMSQHVIRVVPSSNDIAGYLYIWLNTAYGRAMIERYSYGAVIKEIDNKQLAQMPIPVIHDKNKIKQINDLALEANKLRTEAYYLEQEAIEDVNKLMGLDIMEE